MLPSEIQRLVEIVAAAKGRSPHTVGRWAGGTGDFYKRLQRGRDLTTRRAQTVSQWFSDHWPAGVDWPADIPRPTPQPSAEPAKRGRQAA